jgi:hypothetical protein
MYSHKQVGYVILAAILPALALPAILLFTLGARSPLWLPLVVLVPIPLLFGSLTTEVSQDRLTFWFGIGLIRRSFLLSEIESWTTVTNPWYYGWGIHMMRGGWLYNVSGSQAVELRLVSGKMLRIGTDEPAELCRAIRMMRGLGLERPPQHSA